MHGAGAEAARQLFGIAFDEVAITLIFSILLFSQISSSRNLVNRLE
jgi:hypothetical protein